jgi:hypothetical protein
LNILFEHRGVYYAEHLNFNSFHTSDMGSSPPLEAIQQKFNIIIGALTGATGYGLSFAGMRIWLIFSKKHCYYYFSFSSLFS